MPQYRSEALPFLRAGQQRHEPRVAPGTSAPVHLMLSDADDGDTSSLPLGVYLGADDPSVSEGGLAQARWSERAAGGLPAVPEAAEGGGASPAHPAGALGSAFDGAAASMGQPSWDFDRAGSSVLSPFASATPLMLAELELQPVALPSRQGSRMQEPEQQQARADLGQGGGLSPVAHAQDGLQGQWQQRSPIGQGAERRAWPPHPGQAAGGVPAAIGSEALMEDEEHVAGNLTAARMDALGGVSEVRPQMGVAASGQYQVWSDNPAYLRGSGQSSNSELPTRAPPGELAGAGGQRRGGTLEVMVEGSEQSRGTDSRVSLMQPADHGATPGGVEVEVEGSGREEPSTGSRNSSLLSMPPFEMAATREGSSPAIVSITLQGGGSEPASHTGSATGGAGPSASGQAFYRSPGHISRYASEPISPDGSAPSTGSQTQSGGGRISRRPPAALIVGSPTALGQHRPSRLQLPLPSPHSQPLTAAAAAALSRPPQLPRGASRRRSVLSGSVSLRMVPVPARGPSNSIFGARTRSSTNVHVGRGPQDTEGLPAMSVMRAASMGRRTTWQAGSFASWVGASGGGAGADADASTGGADMDPPGYTGPVHRSVHGGESSTASDTDTDRESASSGHSGVGLRPASATHSDGGALASSSWRRRASISHPAGSSFRATALPAIREGLTPTASIEQPPQAVAQSDASWGLPPQGRPSVTGRASVSSRGSQSGMGRPSVTGRASSSSRGSQSGMGAASETRLSPGAGLAAAASTLRVGERRSRRSTSSAGDLAAGQLRRRRRASTAPGGPSGHIDGLDMLGAHTTSGAESDATTRSPGQEGTALPPAGNRRPSILSSTRGPALAITALHRGGRPSTLQRVSRDASAPPHLGRMYGFRGSVSARYGSDGAQQHPEGVGSGRSRLSLLQQHLTRRRAQQQQQLLQQPSYRRLDGGPAGGSGRSAASSSPLDIARSAMSAVPRLPSMARNMGERIVDQGQQVRGRAVDLDRGCDGSERIRYCRLNWTPENESQCINATVCSCILMEDTLQQYEVDM